MKGQVIECVPNFSEGRDISVIDKISEEARRVKGVSLLGVDSGYSANRTVMTLVGAPDDVVAAAFAVIKRASELIDMRGHTGVHPCFGATDVCPLIPVANITMEEVTGYAHRLGKRVGDELGIPVYAYEFAALKEERKSLSYCRSGGYHALPGKLSTEEWRPDFGPAEFIPRAGAVAIGARDFLVAYNVNLNTDSTATASAIAALVRESGRVVGGKVKGEGGLKGVRAIGWYIEEYGVSQVSMNVTDITATPVHVVFEEVCQRAHNMGVKVNGSELVGLIPLRAMLDAGSYFIRKHGGSADVPERDIVRAAVHYLGLDNLHPFYPDKKIIEYLLG